MALAKSGAAIADTADLLFRQRHDNCGRPHVARRKRKGPKHDNDNDHQKFTHVRPVESDPSRRSDNGRMLRGVIQRSFLELEVQRPPCKAYSNPGQAGAGFNGLGMSWWGYL